MKQTSEPELHCAKKLASEGRSSSSSINRLAMSCVSLFVSTQVNGNQSVEVSGYARKHKAPTIFVESSQTCYDTMTMKGDYADSKLCRNYSTQEALRTQQDLQMIHTETMKDGLEDDVSSIWGANGRLNIHYDKNAMSSLSMLQCTARWPCGFYGL